MYILRSERLGTLWFAVGVVACVGVEAWRMVHVVQPEPLRVTALLDALGQMAGPDSTARQPVPIGPQARMRPDGPSFPLVDGEIEVGQLDSAGWVALGLSPRQARGAVRYAESSGGFENMEALARLRMLPDGWMKHYGAQLRFPRRNAARAAVAREASDDFIEDAAALPVDINVADSAALMAIHGVGPWVAGRILAARRSWGGVADLSLLVPALDGWDSLAAALQPAFACSPDAVTKRCVDSLSVDGWRSLPTVGRKEAESLWRRAKHHPGDIRLILTHPAMDSVRRQTLSHYLRPCLVDG